MTISRPRAACVLAWTAVVCLYTLLTLLYLRPIWRVGGDRLAPSLEDPLFNLYVLKWSAHQIQLGLPDLWNANLFYPTRGALALSDHLLGPAAQLVLFLQAVPNAIAGYNFLFFTSFVTSALTVCWVCRRAGLSWAAAVMAGWMYTFSSFRLAQMSHLQLLIAQWIPLTLWFWDRLLAERTLKNAGLFLLFYLLHVTGGCYLAYMIHVPMLVFLINRIVIEKRRLFSLRSLRLLVPVGLIAGAVLAAVFLPYVRVSKTLGLVRTDEEIRQFGATPASYITPSRQNIYVSPATKGAVRALLGLQTRSYFRPERSLFAGILPTLLFFVGAFVSWRRRGGGPVDAWEKGLALSGLLCFALTFAAVYAPLARIVPGLSGMRVPARFYAFVSLALVHFAARGVDFLQEKIPGKRARRALVAILGIVLAVELMPRRLRWVPLEREEEFPAVYHWIARQPSIKALIELPIHEDARENRYIYYSTLHWKPLANGFSGYWPESHARLASRIRFLPDAGGLDLLRSYWISHLVVHVRGPGRQQALQEWEERFLGREVERVFRSGRTSVYRLIDASAPGTRSAPAGENPPAG
jgi:hypothetical protein